MPLFVYTNQRVTSSQLLSIVLMMWSYTNSREERTCDDEGPWLNPAVDNLHQYVILKDAFASHSYFSMHIL